MYIFKIYANYPVTKILILGIKNRFETLISEENTILMNSKTKIETKFPSRLFWSTLTFPKPVYQVDQADNRLKPSILHIRKSETRKFNIYHVCKRLVISR